MARVNRKAIKSFKIEGRTYSTSATTARAFADSLAWRVDATRHTRMEELYGDDDAAWDRYYKQEYAALQSLKEKAYRRCLPIFRKYFAD